jgi:hypothetical protein
MPLTVVKGAGGLRHMVIVSSNAFQDRDKEWVSIKALEQYVKEFGGNDLLIWHRGDRIGQIIEAKLVGAFLVEVARELPDLPVNLAAPGDEPIATTVKQVWDVIERNPDIWGASIGFRYRAGDREDGVYEDIKKYETSLLPLQHAANIFTFARIVEE